MPPGGYFDDTAMNYPAASRGAPNRFYTGFEGSPLDRAGLPGAALGMVAHPYLAGTMGRMHMSPFGIGTGVNPYDQMRSNDFYRMSQQVSMEAANRDRQRMVETMQGTFGVVGAKFGAEQRQAAGALADRMMPLIATGSQFFGDQVDAMAGWKGSSAVMAHRMMQGGRYRVDAVTGRLGMSAASVNASREAIDRYVFDGGRMHEFGGMSAGQMGSMYDEMSRRGLMKGTTSGEIRQQTRSIAATLEGAAPEVLSGAMNRVGIQGGKRAADLSIDDLEKLKLDPQIADRLRSFDAGKTVDSMKQYAKAVGAMKDVLGANGNPNAPMAQIMASLEAISGGNLAKMDPNKLARMVRDTGNLASMNGMDIDTAMRQMHVGMQTAQSFGVENVFGIYGTQRGMASRTGFAGVRNGIGELSGDELTDLKGRRTTATAASKGGNRLGALSRIAQTAGGFEKGSTLDAMMAAIDSGRDEFVDPVTGKQKSVHMSDPEFAKAIAGAKGRDGKSLGLDIAGAREMLSQTDENRKYLDKNSMAVAERLGVKRDVGRYATSQMSRSLESALRGTGMSKEEARRVAQTSSADLFEQMSGLQATLSPEERRKELSKMLGENLRKSGGAAAADTMNLDVLADRVYGSASKYLKDTGKGSLTTNLMLGNRGVNEQTDRNEIQARMTGSIQEALSPLRSDSVVRNIAGALQGVDPKDPDAFARVMSQAMGGLDKNAVSATMAEPLKRAGDAYKALESQRKELDAEKDPVKRKEMEKILQSKQAALSSEMGNVRAVMDSNNIFWNESAEKAGVDPKNKENVKKAFEAFGTGIKTDADARAVLAARGKEATPEAIAEMRKKGVISTMDEAFAARESRGAVEEKESRRRGWYNPAKYLQWKDYDDPAVEKKEVASTGGGSGSGQGGGPMEIRGKLTIEGNTGDFNARTAGAGIDHMG